MFDWLGLTPSAVQIIGCVLIGISCLLFIILVIVMIKTLREIKRDKKLISSQAEKEQPADKTAIKVEKQPKKEKLTAVAEKEQKAENLPAESKEEKSETVANEYLLRLKKLSEEEKAYYTEIKNAILSYGEFKSNLIVDGETFKFNNRNYGSITIKKGILKFYLKLSKKDLDQRFNNETSEFKKYQKTPMEFVLDKDVELRKAKKSIDDLAEELELKVSEKYKNKTFATLIKKFD